MHNFIEQLLSRIPQYGYSILFALVFLESMGVPIPAPLALVAAGAASARGSLQPALAGASAFFAMAAGDTLMFVLGRHTGWWLLGLLCRLSLNPESCMLRTANSFSRRGRVVLLFAKFVPGLNTMVAPLAGSMNMRFGQFLRFDACGVALYVAAYLSLGMMFSRALSSITVGYRAFGSVAGWVLLAAVATYVGLQLRSWVGTRALAPVPSALPKEVARALASGEALIYDVRSHGYYDPKATRIPGSRRLDPNALGSVEVDIPAGKRVYLYCTCRRGATSVRVARLLRDKGLRGAVIEGGLRAWKKAGLPVERIPSEDLAPMPAFGPRPRREIQLGPGNV